MLGEWKEQRRGNDEGEQCKVAVFHEKKTGGCSESRRSGCKTWITSMGAIRNDIGPAGNVLDSSQYQDVIQIRTVKHRYYVDLDLSSSHGHMRSRHQSASLSVTGFDFQQL